MASPSTLNTSRRAPYLSSAQPPPPPPEGTIGGAMTPVTAGREAGPDCRSGGAVVPVELEALWNISKLKLAVMLALAAPSGGGEVAASRGGEVAASRGATPGVLEKLANSGTAGEEEEKLPKSSAAATVG